jgi:hypothetical protein
MEQSCFPTEPNQGDIRQPANQGNSGHTSTRPSDTTPSGIPSTLSHVRFLQVMALVSWGYFQKGMFKPLSKLWTVNNSFRNPPTILPIPALLPTWWYVYKVNCYQREYVHRARLFNVTSSKQQQFVLRNQLLLLHRQRGAMASHAYQVTCWRRNALCRTYTSGLAEPIFNPLKTERICFI